LIPAGTEAVSALREVSAAWRRADLMPCEQIGTRVFDALDLKRRQLKGVPEFPRDGPTAGEYRYANRKWPLVIAVWHDCYCAQYSVAPALSLVAFLTGNASVLVDRQTAFASLQHEAWDVDGKPHSSSQWACRSVRLFSVKWRIWL